MKPRPLAVPLPMRAGAFIVPDEVRLSATRARHEPRPFQPADLSSSFATVKRLCAM